MIKKILIVSIFALAFSASAQSDTLGKNRVSIGFGYPNLGKTVFNALQFEKNFSIRSTGPFHLKYENRVSPYFGFGISINHTTFTVNYKKDFIDTNSRIVTNNIEIASNSTAFNFRTNVHFVKPSSGKKYDVYVGFGIGVKTGKLIITADYQDNIPEITLPYNNFGFEFTGGYRYFFDPNIGFYVEAGFAKSIIQAGAVARF